MLKDSNCQGMDVKKELQNVMLLLYADDITNGSKTVTRLQQQITNWNVFCVNYGLSIN